MHGGGIAERQHAGLEERDGRHGVRAPASTVACRRADAAAVIDQHLLALVGPRDGAVLRREGLDLASLKRPRTITTPLLTGSAAAQVGRR